MKKKITGDWSGEPIWREETVQERLLNELVKTKAIDQNKKSGYCYNQDGYCENDNCRCK